MERFGVIFDMDGVVADTQEADFASWKRILHEHGKTLSLAQYKDFLGMKGVDIMTRFLGEDIDAPSLLERKEQYHLDDIKKQGLHSPDGLKQFLTELKAKHTPIALATGAVKYKVDAVLEELGLKSTFNVIVTADDIKNGKPDPEIFLKAAEKLGLPAERCVVIEDAPLGIKAAKAAGMIAVGITTTHETGELAEADIIIDDFFALTVPLLSDLLP